MDDVYSVCKTVHLREQGCTHPNLELTAKGVAIVNVPLLK